MHRIALAAAVVALGAAACIHEPARTTVVVDDQGVAPSSRAAVYELNPERRAPEPRSSTSEATARAAAAAELDTTGPHPRGDRGGPAALSPGWYPVPAPSIELDTERRTADPWRDRPQCEGPGDDPCARLLERDAP